MASQDAELQLKVSLDLAFFRQQLTGLGQSAAGYSVPIFIKFDRQTIANEYRLLSRYIGGKDFRIKIQSNLEAEVKRAETLVKTIGELRQTGQGQEGTLPIGIGGIASIKPKEARKIRTALRRSILSEGGKILIPTSIVAAITQVDVAAFKKAVTEKLSGIKVEVGVQTGKFSSTGTGAAGLHEYMRSQGMSGGNMPGAASVGRSERLRKALEEQTVNQLKELAKGQGLSGYSKLNKNSLINKLIAELGNDAAEALLGNIKMQMGNAGKSPIKRSFLDQIARAVLFMAGVDPSQLRAQPRKLPEVNWPTTAVPRQSPPIGPSSTGRLLGAAAGPAGLISGNTGPFGLLPKVTSKGSLEDAIRMISGKQADMGGPGALSLSSAAMGKRINAILTEYFKVVEIQVKETFDPGELNRSLNAFAYLVQSLRDAESRIKQARVAQSVDSLMQSIDAAVKTAQAKVRIVGTEVFDLGQRMQPMLPPGRTAGLLPAGVGRTPSPYATGATGGETQAQIFARREREARTRSDLRSVAITGTAMVPYAPGGAIVPTGGAGAPPSPPRPPSGGAGGGMGAFGRALGNVQLPGAGLVREIGSEFAMAAKQVLLFGTAYKALAAITSFPGQVMGAVSSLQSFRNTLSAISPTAKEAAESSQFILDTVQKYNIPLESARDGFTKLYASMKPAGFSTKEINNLYLGISKASATLGLSADKVDRVNYAFAQMASKGQLMSEEVSGQLGDVIPGALSIMAEAAQMDIKTFKKAMEDGVFVGKAFEAVMSNVPIVLEKRFGKGAEGAAKTFQGAINNMQTSLALFYESFEPIAVGFLNSVVTPITNGLTTMTDGFSAFFAGTRAKTAGGSAFAQELKNLQPSFDGIMANLKALIPSFQLFGSVLLNVAKVFTAIIGNPVIGFLLKVYANVLLVNAAFNLLGGRILLGLIASINASIGRFIALNVAMASLQRTSAVTNSTLAGSQLQMQLLNRNAISPLIASLARLATFAAIAIAITITINGREELNEVQRQIDKLKGDKNPVGPAGPVPIPTAARNYAGATREKVRADQQKQLDFVAKLRKDLKGLEKAFSLGMMPEIATKRMELLRLSIAKAEEVLNLNPQQFKTAAEQQAQGASALLPIPPGGGDAKAAEKAQREAEKLANQNQQLSIDAANRQNALDKTRFEGLASLTDEQYQHELALIDSRNAYELTGRNSIEARQRKFQQDLLQVELRRIDAVRKAQADVQKAQLDVTMATRAAQAAQSNEVSFMPGRKPGSVSPAKGSSFQGFPVTSVPGESRAYRNGTHEGYDFGTPIGTALSYAIGGVVKSIDKVGRGNAGKLIEVTLDNGIVGLSMHLSEVMLEAGQRFEANQIIAKTGDTGAGPAHLHQESAAHAYKTGQAGASLAYLNIGKGKARGARPSAVNTMQRREDKTENKAEVEQLQLFNTAQLANIAIRNGITKTIEETKTLIAQNIDIIYPVAEMQLENNLMKIRNDLQMQGMPSEYIDFREKAFKADYEGSLALEKLTFQLGENESSLAKMQKKKADNVSLSAEEIVAYGNVDNAIQLLTGKVNEYKEGLVDLEIAQKAFKIASLESAIATMKNADAFKAQQETMDLIKGSVESASNGYKGFLKEVATGGDPTEALQKFQQGLTDQVLTIFLDYAFKPVEDFFKDSLSNLFNVPTEDEQRKKGQAALERQLELVKSIDTKVGAIANQTPQPGKTSNETTKNPVEASNTNAITDGAVSGLSGQAVNQILGGDSAAVYKNMRIPDIGKMFDSIDFEAAFDPVRTSFAVTLENLSSTLNASTSELSQSAENYSANFKSVGDSASDMAKKAGETAEEAKNNGDKLKESLGKVASGIGIAAGAIMGIAAGISQVKKGGTGNTLMGIGSVLASVGGAIGGFSKLSKAANGAVWTGGFQAFANGGTVKGPTLGLVGEGKYNEAIVPLPDGRSIPVQMRGGPGGGSSRDLLSTQAQSRSSPSVLSMSFQSTTINGVEYVDRAQLEMAMAETRRVASRDGAARGANLAIDRLANSPSSRRRAGIR